MSSRLKPDPFISKLLPCHWCSYKEISSLVQTKPKLIFRAFTAALQSRLFLERTGRQLGRWQICQCYAKYAFAEGDVKWKRLLSQRSCISVFCVSQCQKVSKHIAGLCLVLIPGRWRLWDDSLVESQRSCIMNKVSQCQQAGDSGPMFEISVSLKTGLKEV